MIVAAAVKYKNVIYTGVRHWEIFNDLRRLGHSGPFFESCGYIQGFITNNNIFMNREEAKQDVLKCNQYCKSYSSILTSEDLW